MMPKIADFGLSRLVGNTQTYITRYLIGTRGYMPPEYIQNLQISKKYDVFSLGVIIIEIMAGPLGYSKYDEMSSQQFIELVRRLSYIPGMYTKTGRIGCIQHRGMHQRKQLIAWK
ncbi:hypothetical protein BAE44_0025002 [Dichanthelium oligosanthes]|uniref:Protein kinase domain-containing protein n=1 Tax=Dichanthelium oligosanthes TaxID=888268 RepID=A0A1E5UM77_9POAL|nr:hypothetical protein BAE44_0025002 [Dichanthelium oligosanthes]